MQKIIPFLILVFISNLSLAQLPTNLDLNIPFGTTEEAFQKLRPNAEKKPNPMFDEVRKVHKETLNKGGVKEVTWYIDTDTDVLYEAILLYNDANEAVKQGKLLFGEPNFEGSQWRVENKDGQRIWAYTFKSKLIIIAILPGTEHEDKGW